MNDETPKHDLNHTKQAVISYLGKLANPRHARTVGMFAAGAVLCLAATVGFVDPSRLTDLLGGCGKAKVSGKTICEYEELIRSSEDESDLVGYLEKVERFGAKGQHAMRTLTEVIHTNEEDTVRTAALKSLCAIGKEHVVDVLMPLLNDQEVEFSEEFRTSMFSKVAEQTKPDEYQKLFVASVGSDLERVTPLLVSLRTLALNEKSSKGSKQSARVNGLVDTMLWVAEFDPGEGDLSPSDSFLSAKAAQFERLAGLTLPSTRKVATKDFGAEVDDKKIAEISPRITALAEKLLEAGPEKFSTASIAMAVLMQKDPEASFERYTEFLKQWKDVGASDRGGLAVPFLTLFPASCIEKTLFKGSLDDGEKPASKGGTSAKDGAWKESVADKILGLMEEYSSDADVLPVLTGIGFTAANCELPGADKIIVQTVRTAVDGGAKPPINTTTTQFIVKKIAEKKIPLDIGRKYLDMLATTGDSTARFDAAEGIKKLVADGVISREDYERERAARYTGMTPEERRNFIKDTGANATSPEEKISARDTILGALANEQDPQMREYGYDLLLESVLSSNWPESAPAWERAILDQDSQLGARYEMKLRRVFYPGYPMLGYRPSQDPAPIVPVLFKVAKRDNFDGSRSVSWGMLKALARLGVLDTKTNLQILGSALTTTESPSEDTLRMAAEVLKRVGAGDKEQVISTMLDVVTKAPQPRGRGFARAVLDRIDHTKSRVDIESGSIKLSLRPRADDYKLENLVSAVNKADKAGLGFLALRYGSHGNVMEEASKLPAAEVWALDGSRSVLRIVTLPAATPERGRDKVSFENPARFLVVVPKGTAEAQKVVEGAQIPFDAAAIEEMDAANRILSR